MGGGGVGKSSLTVQFVHSVFTERYDPTIEDSYRKTLQVDGTLVACHIMDTAGTEQFLALHSMYIQSGDGFVLVFSLTNTESLVELQGIREQVVRMKGNDGRRRVPMVLVGNKCDLVSERQVGRDRAIAVSRGWSEVGAAVPYYESSARKRVNVSARREEWRAGHGNLMVDGVAGRGGV